jgi:hypothetical protein
LGTAIASLFSGGGLACDIPELRGERIQGAKFDA